MQAVQEADTRRDSRQSERATTSKLSLSTPTLAPPTLTLKLSSPRPHLRQAIMLNATAFL